MDKSPLQSQKIIFFVNIFVLIVLLDQYFKQKIRHSGGFFVCNSGISFDINIPNLNFWLIISFFLISLILIHKISSKKEMLFFGFIFLLAGAFSNLLDRYFFGCVLDFISIFNNFPLFNLADVFIFIGCILIFYHYVTPRKQNSA